jgi:hypothetical protein
VSDNFGLQWALRVISREPAKPSTIPVDQRAEAFADLAAAYEVLADQAGADGEVDREIGRRELSEHYEWLAEQWRREGDLP